MVRNLEIIGEASHHLPEEFKSRHADIPWSKMGGLRNRIVHDYIGIDQELIWHIVQSELVPLKSDIERLL